MRFKDFKWLVFFFLLGAISIMAQTVFLREITTLFYGNEFFYGFGLGFWLLFTGLGSLLATRLKFLKKRKSTPWLILGILTFFLPFLVIFLRWSSAQLVPLGELSGPGFSFGVAGLTLLVFCFPSGAAFPLAVLAWQRKKAANRGYLWETLGFVFGGLIFSFILATTNFPLGTKLDHFSHQWRYPGLVQAFNSPYNQIVVSRTLGQENFFINGQLAFTTQEAWETQQLLSLITPFTNEPKTALILGNPNLATEIKTKLSIDQVDFLELDNKLLELERKVLAKDVNPVLIDLRKFLNQSQQEWDLIVFSPGNPQTLLLNRYFTQECFEQVKRHLSDRGIFTLVFYLPTDYQSEEAVRFAGSIYKTLKQSFPFLELITPQDQLVFILSKTEIKIKEEQVDSTWQEHFWYQIKDKKRSQILQTIEKAKVKINTDFDPVGFFYQHLFWQTMFSFKAPRLLLKTVGLIPWFLLVSLLIVLRKAKKGLRLAVLVASSSFILMSLEILIIFMFQAKIGYLYSQISLIFAIVLSGMAMGVKLGERVKKLLKVLKISFLTFLAVFLVFAFALKSTLSESIGFWLVIIFFSGLIDGLIFNLVNQLYLKDKNRPGFIYAFDLFGGFLGAFLTSALLLPVFGVKNLLIGLAASIGLILLI